MEATKNKIENKFVVEYTFIHSCLVAVSIFIQYNIYYNLRPFFISLTLLNSFWLKLTNNILMKMESRDTSV